MRPAVEKPGLHVRLAEALVLAGILCAAALRLFAPVEAGPPPAVETLLRLDPNRAPWHELACLPGLGPVRAREIVRDREERGPFASVEELSRVRGIGPATVEAVRGWLLVGTTGSGE